MVSWRKSGVPWMFGAIVSFVLMAIAAREMSTEFDASQILFWRSLVGAILMPLVLSFCGWWHVKTQQFGLQILRGGIHFVAQYGWFFGITMIPLADVFALEFTAPIWTVLFAAVFLAERLSVMRLSAVGFGFVGVLIVLRPGDQVIDPAALVVLASAGLYAITYVMVKVLTRTDSALCIMFYMSYVQLALATIVVGQFALPSLALWPWVFMVGATGLTAHFCMAQALSRSNASVVMLIDFFRLPMIMLVGFWFYNEAIDPWVFLGALVIFVGNYLNIRHVRARASDK